MLVTTQAPAGAPVPFGVPACACLRRDSEEIAEVHLEGLERFFPGNERPHIFRWKSKLRSADCQGIDAQEKLKAPAPQSFVAFFKIGRGTLRESQKPGFQGTQTFRGQAGLDAHVEA
jgi:hypothetical protein